MYLTGNQSNFQNRLHSLPSGVDDVCSFRNEGVNYTFSSGHVQHINKEYQKKYYLFTRTGSYLTGWYFSACGAVAQSFSYESGVALNNMMMVGIMDEYQIPQGVSINNIQIVGIIDEV